MNESGASDPYDAFFVFDADNKLDKHYIGEMNKGFQAGFKILTSYRNSVNLSDNWVSSGSALWFIRESRFVSASRMWLGNSCHVGGTGFMFSQEIMRRNNGWKFHLLTEDLEFTMDSVLHGDRIGYCGTAILYDEQPVTFAQSWRQRLRWSKGFLQVFRYYKELYTKLGLYDQVQPQLYKFLTAFSENAYPSGSPQKIIMDMANRWGFGVLDASDKEKKHKTEPDA